LFVRILVFSDPNASSNIIHIFGIFTPPLRINSIVFKVSEMTTVQRRWDSEGKQAIAASR
jgi:hypothetical protein